MSYKVKEITSYLRSAVASQVNRCIDFKKNNYCYFTFEQLLKGKIDDNIFIELSKGVKQDRQVDSIDVILVGKTIRTIFDSQEKKNSDFEDLTGIYFIPAKLKKDGSLLYSQGKLPWIPRAFLFPMIEPKLSIGKKDEYDNYMSDSIGRIHRIKTWDEYIVFAKDLYENITKNDFMGEVINDTKLENQVYILKDDTINAVGSILELYDDILDKDNVIELYEKFISLEPTSRYPLIGNTLNEMNMHCGQMGGEYPLSPSQRESINHFNHMTDGEILAVNGPPGTGKTTLIQSVVANMYVERALNKEKPPIIIASSTNNQAVTNIIDSFSKITSLSYGNLEERWIEGVNSFAVYFPSSAKNKEAAKQGYQYTDQSGKNFISSIESKENIQASKEKMIQSCKQYFGQEFTNIDEYEECIHKTLLKIDDIRKQLLSISNELEILEIGDKMLDGFIAEVEKEIEGLKEDINIKYKRIKAWENHFKQFPIWHKIFKFMRCVRRKIETKNRMFIEFDEDFISECMSFEEIEEKYSFIIKDIKIKLNKLGKVYKKVKGIQQQYIKCFEELQSLKIGIVDIKDKRYTKLDGMNKLMDQTLRYIEFWLSVHYYECRWVKGEDELTDKQRGKTYNNILEKVFNRLSMVTPCYVTTFYQLPKNFKYYIEDKKYSFLYNFIDLLIVDEAGQVPPEIAACSFSLAKRAIVVGDIHQIKPVWSVNRSLDKSLAIEHKVIENQSQFELLEEMGINASNSSVMKVASESCKYKKYDNGGLFLSEHRRCYNEIISYCNELVYKGHLNPMRGIGVFDSEYKLRDIPHMGYSHVCTERSSKKGSSRYNRDEVIAITNWINQNFEMVKEAYHGEDEKSLIGVITPFKAQLRLMEKEFKKLIHKNIRENINVGTVHTFQGAERRIIILSTVYGKTDGCYFIDIDNSMLNVAVSRAKDSFLVFGEIDCFNKSKQCPSGLLRSYIINNSINVPVTST